MAFKRIKGFKGKIFVPEDDKSARKHNCEDCFSCGMCSDERCRVCLKSHCCRDKDNKEIASEARGLLEK